MMDLGLLRDRLRYNLEHPKCQRCGKEIYIPRPPKELYESWGIMSWTAFVKQYIKHHGWYELDNLNGNIVCDRCLCITNIPNNIMLKSYDEWIKKYKEWRQGTTKRTI